MRGSAKSAKASSLQNGSAEADRRMIEYEAKMKSAQKEAETMILEAKLRAQHVQEENERRLSADAERIKAAATRDIDQERRRALEEVCRSVSDLALLIAEKLVERSLNDADHKRLVEESLAAVAKDYEKS